MEAVSFGGSSHTKVANMSNINRCGKIGEKIFHFRNAKKFKSFRMRRQIGREKSLQKWEDVSKSSLRKGTASGNCFVEYLVLSNLL